MTGAEYYGLTKNFDPENKGCTDWTFDVGYGQTFGKQAELEYMADVDRDGKTCGHCLWVDTYCTYADCYPNEIDRRLAVS